MAESDSAPAAPICIADLEQHAKKVLNKMTWEYYFHGAADEITRLDNLEAFNRFVILREHRL
jgi:(S)-2-hydroxy-acid oxidase